MFPHCLWAIYIIKCASSGVSLFHMNSLSIKAGFFASGSNNLSLHTADHTDLWNRPRLHHLSVYCTLVTQRLIPNACLFIVCQTLLGFVPNPINAVTTTCLLACPLMEFKSAFTLSAIKRRKCMMQWRSLNETIDPYGTIHTGYDQKTLI